MDLHMLVSFAGKERTEREFRSLYDRAGYDFSLDYARPVEPPLAKEDQEWVRQVLKDRRLSS